MPLGAFSAGFEKPPRGTVFSHSALPRPPPSKAGAHFSFILISPCLLHLCVDLLVPQLVLVW